MLDLAATLLLGLLAAQLVLHRRLLAALWFRHEDPRPIALLRIATGALTLAWLVDLVPLLDYLFSSEGVVVGERAHQAWGRLGPYSPLFEHDSPAFVRAYVIALGIAASALTLGLLTPLAKWLTWGLFVGLVARNGLFGGGDQVFACFLFYLCLARCGHAYGVDAWWYRRRHGQRRRIPAWPRNLMLLQLIAVFCANGLAKHGAMWRAGDTVYYIFNHPHFRPAELWGLSAALGTNLMRLATWVTHAFELLFFLVVVGMVVRFVRAHPERMPTGRARALGRALGVAIGLDVIAMAWLALPREARSSMPFVVSMAIGLAAALGPLTVAAARRLPPVLLRWLLGRRLWVSLWLLFTAQLAFVLQIGWFTALTMCSAVLVLEGDELDRLRDRAGGPAPAAPSVEPTPPGPWRRRAIAALSAVHVLAVMAVLLPHDQPPSPWRRAAEQPLRRWIRQTTFSQHWRMFAPTGASAPLELEVVLRDADGRAIALGGGMVPPERAASPWGLDKQQKVRRRLADERSGRAYWPWHARWVCRRFGSLVDGPSTVELYSLRTPLPSPRALQVLGVDEALARAEAEAQRTLVFDEPCRP